MKVKQLLSLTIAALFAASTVSLQLSAFAEQPLSAAENSAVQDDGVELIGTDSFGSMISEEFSNQQNDADELAFAINRIKVTDDYKAVIDLTLAADCKVIVAVYDESGTELITSAEQYAEDGTSTVTVQLDGEAIPQYYLLKAFIVSLYNDIALSTEYIDDSHTRKWSNFRGLTTADFPAELVYDLDGDPTDNFVVFNSNVVRITGGTDTDTFEGAAHADNGLMEYTFSNCTDDMMNLNTGDLLSYMDGNSWILLKVDYTTGWDPLTVVGRKADVEEFFSVVKLNLDMEDFVEFTLESAESENTPINSSADTYSNSEPEANINGEEPAGIIEHTQTSDSEGLNRIEIHGACGLTQEGTEIDDAEMTYGGYIAYNDTKLPYFGAKISSDGFQYVAKSDVMDGLEAEIALGDETDAALTFENGLEATWDHEDLLKIEYQPEENGPKLEVNVKKMLDFLDGKKPEDDDGPEFAFAASADIIFDEILFSFNFFDFDGTTEKKLELGYNYDVTLDVKADVSYKKEIPLGAAAMDFYGILLQVKFKLNLEGEVNFEDKFTDTGSFYALFSSSNLMPIIHVGGPFIDNRATAEGNGSIKFTTEGSASIINTLLKVKLSLAEKLTISVEKGGTKNGQPFAVHRCRDCSTGRVKLKLSFGYAVSAGFGLLTLSQEIPLSDVTIAHFHICYDCSEGNATHPFKGTIQLGQCPCIGTSRVIIYPFFDDAEDDNKYLYSYADVPSDYYKDLTADIYTVNRATGKLDLFYANMSCGGISLDSADPDLFGNVKAFFIDAVPDTEYAVDIHFGAYNSPELLYFTVDAKSRVYYENSKLSPKHKTISYFNTENGQERIENNTFYIPAALSKGVSKTGKVYNANSGNPLGFGTAIVTYVSGAQTEDDIKNAIANNAVKTINVPVKADGTFTFVFPPDDRNTKCWYMSYYGKYSDPTGWLPDVIYTALNKLYKDAKLLSIAAYGNQSTVLRFVDDSGTPLSNEILSHIKLTLTDSYGKIAYTGNIIPDRNGEYEVHLPYKTYYIEAEFFQRSGSGYAIDKTVTDRDDSISITDSGSMTINLFGTTATICASGVRHNVEVFVEDYAGNPASGVSVWGDCLNSSRVSTDENGRAVLKLPAGLNYIYAYDVYGNGFALVDVDGDITGGNAVKLRLSNTPLPTINTTIAIKTADGKPAAGASVKISCYDMLFTTDDNGEFTVKLPKTELNLKAEYNGMSEEWVFLLRSNYYSEYLTFTFGTSVQDNYFVKAFTNWKYNYGITSNGSLYEIQHVPDYGGGYPRYINLDGKAAKDVKFSYGNIAVLTEDGSVYIWGSNAGGQLGDGTTEDCDIPRMIDMGGKKVKSVSLADETNGYYGRFDYKSQVIMLTEDGELYLLGCDYGGHSLGGSETCYTTPQRIDIPEKIIKYYPVKDDFNWSQSIAIAEDGSLYLWGRRGLGQKPAELSVDGKPVESIRKVKDSYYMAKTRDGSLYDWTSLKRETDKFVFSNAQEPVLLLDNASVYSSFSNVMIATTTDGKLYVWGSTSYNQAQNGLAYNEKPVEVVIPGETFSNPNTHGIVGGGIAIIADSGNLYMWGRYGNKIYPRPILVDTDVVYINTYGAGATSYDYYLKSTGEIYVRLVQPGSSGTETVDYIEPAERVNTDSRIISIPQYSLALSDDGKLITWDYKQGPWVASTSYMRYADVQITDINGKPISGAKVSAGDYQYITGSTGKVRLSFVYDVTTITAEYRGVVVKQLFDSCKTDLVDDNGVTIRLNLDITQAENNENAVFTKAYSFNGGALLISENGVVYIMQQGEKPYILSTCEPIADAAIYSMSQNASDIILLSESGKVYYGYLGSYLKHAEIPERVTEIDVNKHSFIAITETGKLYTWEVSMSEDVKPELFTLINGKINSYSYDDEVHFAIGANNVLYTWTDKYSDYTLGRDDSVYSNKVPGLVNLSNAAKLVSYKNAAAALTSDGEVYLWGNTNALSWSPLAEPKSLVKTPEKAVLPEKIKDISAYNDCFFALSESGKLYVWGIPIRKAEPVSGSEISAEHYSVIDISEPVVKFCHSDTNAFAVTESGKLYAWGKKGLLGTAEQTSDQYIPSLIDIDNKAVVDISMYSNTVSVLTADGSVYFWNSSSNLTPTQIEASDIQLAFVSSVDSMMFSGAETYEVNKYYSGIEDGIYNFYARNPKDNSLVYINQYTAAYGSLSITFNSSIQKPDCYIRKLSSVNIEDAEITVEKKPFTGISVCEVNVVLNGVTLTQGKDYVLYGDVMASEPDVYEALVIGKGDYYGTQKIGWEITAPAPIDHISILSVPNKVEYAIGEELDTSGGRIEVSCTDGSTYIVLMTADMVSGFDSSKTGNQTLTVTYKGKTAEFDVTVSEIPVEAVLEYIKLTKLPSKTTYRVGDKLDLTGAVLVAFYSDGTSQRITITDDMVSGFDSSKTGNQTLTITYNGKTATFTIKVTKSSSSGGSSGGGSSGGGSGRKPISSGEDSNKISVMIEYRNIGRAAQPGTLEKVSENGITRLKTVLETHAAGCWANLMKNNGDKPEFLSAVQVQKDGSVLFENAEAAKYTIIVDTCTYMTGDANDDLSVNALDASIILKYVVGIEVLSDNKLLSLDCNGDQAVSAQDASWILKKVIGLVV